MRNLRRAPRATPAARLPAPMTAPLPRHRRPAHRRAVRGATIPPARRSCTYCRSAACVASFASFGRRVARSACHCAVAARYSSPPLRVAALRRSSREIVDAARPSRRAISRTPCLWTRNRAICSRSENDRYLPESGGYDRVRCDGGIPPLSRNHRTPTTGDTRASAAAASLEQPAAIAAQNRWRSSRRPTGGRPGERSLARPDRSDRRSLRLPPSQLLLFRWRCCDDRLSSGCTPRSL